MGKKKHQKKRKPQYSLPLTPEEENLLRSLLETHLELAPSTIAEKLPTAALAQALIDGLPVDHPEGPDLVLAVQASFDGKNIRKTAKKWLFRRKQKGLSVPDLDLHEDAPLLAKQPPETDPEAFLGPIDGFGNRAVFISIPQLPRGVDVGLGIISDAEGIREFVFGRYSKKRMREVKALFFENAGPMVGASLSHAGAVLENAYGQGEANAAAATSGYNQLRPWLLENAPPFPRPAAFEHMDTESISKDILTDSQIRKLLDHPYMLSWVIDPDTIQPILDEIKNAKESPILISEEQKRARIREIKESAVSEIYPDSDRRRLKGRLEEMAYVFLKTEEEEFARLSLAAALSLEERDSIIGVNPFLMALVERTLGFYAEAIEKMGKTDPGGAAAPGSIIVP